MPLVRPTLAVIRVIPNKGILLMCADMYKSVVQRALPGCNIATVGSLSGSLAGLTAVLATYPLELVRTRQAYRICDDLCLVTQTISSTLRDVVASKGLMGLYSGVGATLIGALPFEGARTRFPRPTAPARTRRGGRCLTRAPPPPPSPPPQPPPSSLRCHRR